MDVQDRTTESADAREQIAAVGQHADAGIAEAVAGMPALHQHQLDQFAWIVHRETAQQQGVHEAEDGRIGADSEG